MLEDFAIQIPEAAHWADHTSSRYPSINSIILPSGSRKNTSRLPGITFTKINYRIGFDAIPTQRFNGRFELRHVESQMLEADGLFTSVFALSFCLNRSGKAPVKRTEL